MMRVAFGRLDNCPDVIVAGQRARRKMPTSPFLQPPNEISRN